MDEKRQFFRITNAGEIQARTENNRLDVVEISSSGVVVIKKNDSIASNGIVELKILTYTVQIHYQILRTEKDTMILVFKNEVEINNLFIILKQLKDQQKNTPANK